MVIRVFFQLRIINFHNIDDMYDVKYRQLPPLFQDRPISSTFINKLENIFVLNLRMFLLKQERRILHFEMC